MSEQGTRESCTCDRCVSSCHRTPGWMKPGEAEKIATYLHISLRKLFREKLAVDWWTGTTPTFVLSPAIVGKAKGAEMPYVAKGTCVFLKEGRCSIHPVKPFECAVSFCGDGPVERKGSAHEVCAKAWMKPKHQKQITELLGREAEEAHGSIFELFNLL